jgi:hypothetical protein
MAVALFLRFADLTAAQYDRMVVSLELDANPPVGQLLHVAAEAEEGIECCDVWRTPEAAVAFLEQRLRPALLQVGAEPPDVRIVPLHNLFAPELDAIERIGSVSLPAHVAASSY